MRKPVLSSCFVTAQNPTCEFHAFDRKDKPLCRVCYGEFHPALPRLLYRPVNIHHASDVYRANTVQHRQSVTVAANPIGVFGLKEELLSMYDFCLYSLISASATSSFCRKKNRVDQTLREVRFHRPLHASHARTRRRSRRKCHGAVPVPGP